MKKKTKIIISVVCAVLAVCIAAVAYSMLRVKKIEAKDTLPRWTELTRRT